MWANVAKFFLAVNNQLSTVDFQFGENVYWSPGFTSESVAN